LVDDDGTFVGQYAMHLVTTPDDFARAAIEHLEPLMLTACIHAVRNAGCLDMITRLIDESANVVEPLPGGGDSAKPGQGVGREFGMGRALRQQGAKPQHCWEKPHRSLPWRWSETVRTYWTPAGSGPPRDSP